MPRATERGGSATAPEAIIDRMAQLIVRNLDEEIVTRLRQRAAKHRRSTKPSTARSCARRCYRHDGGALH
jgi:hypothetical protein